MLATNDRGRDPRHRRRLRAVHARASSTSTTSSRCSNRGRTSSRRAVSSSRAATASATKAAPASLDACARGGSSIYATGSSPGFITETLPLALLSLQRHVDVDRDRRVRRTCRGATRRTCSSSRWGSGSRSTSYDPQPRRVSRSASSARRSRCSPQAANRPVDDWTVRGEVAAARETTTLARGRAPGRHRRRAAHHDRRDKCDGDDVVRFTRELVLHHRRRAGVGSAADGLAGARARRRAVRRRAHVPGPARRARGDHARATPRTGRSTRSRTCARRAPGILSTTDLPPITPAGPLEPDAGALRAGERNP